MGRGKGDKRKGEKNMKVLLACFMYMAIGCATASQPTVQMAASQPTEARTSGPLTEQWSRQIDMHFDPENETAVGYLQLYAWRLDAAANDAVEAPDIETARAILSEGESDVTRLRQEYSLYWETSDHSCYYCGPVCREMEQKLLGEQALVNEDNACRMFCCWTPPS